MSAFNECDLIKWDKFIDGEYNEVLNNATFKSRSKNKDHNFKTCDLIITADTETSQQRRNEALKQLQVVEAFRGSKSRNKPEWMILKVVPIIPP